jgi:hypothetical protein
MKSSSHKNIAVVFLCSLALCVAAWGGTSGVSRRPVQPQPRAARLSPDLPDRQVVRWGLPLDGGSLRVLAIAPGYALRDAAELALRLDMDLEVFDVDRLLPGREGDPDGSAAEKDLDRLKSLLSKKFDAIMAGNFSFSILPDDAVEALVGQVRDGTGLLLAHHRDGLPEAFSEFLDALVPVESTDIITRGVGAELTPEWQGGLGFVQGATYERGRVVELMYGGDPPLFHAFLPSLEEPEHSEPQFADVYYSLVAKALRWVAGREPPVQIDRIKAVEAPVPDAEYIPPGLDEQDSEDERFADLDRPIRHFVAYLNRPAADEYHVRAQLRKPGWTQQPDWDFGEKPLPKGAESYEMQLPAVPGVSLLDLWLLRGGRVVEWHTEAITIPVRPDFLDISFSKSELMANDSLDVGVVIRPSDIATVTRPEGQRERFARKTVVCVRAVDPFGRVVAQQFYEMARTGGAGTVQLGVADLFTNRVRVEVYLFTASPRRNQFNASDLR